MNNNNIIGGVYWFVMLINVMIIRSKLGYLYITFLDDLVIVHTDEGGHHFTHAKSMD